jgi:peptide-methionine (R)-S-oxide reductase
VRLALTLALALALALAGVGGCGARAGAGKGAEAVEKGAEPTRAAPAGTGEGAGAAGEDGGAIGEIVGRVGGVEFRRDPHGLLDPLPETEEQWQALLSPQQYQVLRGKGTERAFTGRYWNDHRDGVYRCAACGAPLFDAATKYESGSGWPSFWQPVAPEAVAIETDRSHGMVRTEIVCGRCSSHLGHVFEDGPEPTGLRYCTNSASLTLAPAPPEAAGE